MKTNTSRFMAESVGTGAVYMYFLVLFFLLMCVHAEKSLLLAQGFIPHRERKIPRSQKLYEYARLMQEKKKNSSSNASMFSETCILKWSLTVCIAVA